jgi:hypothetical protein
MGNLDVPEILIAVGVFACIVWALHNWRNTRTHTPK